METKPRKSPSKVELLFSYKISHFYPIWQQVHTGTPIHDLIKLYLLLKLKVKSLQRVDSRAAINDLHVECLRFHRLHIT